MTLLIIRSSSQVREEGFWKPANWSDIVLPIADFLRIVLQRFRSDEPEKVAQFRALLEALASSADAFEPAGSAIKSVGYKSVMSCIRSLQE